MRKAVVWFIAVSFAAVLCQVLCGCAATVKREGYVVAPSGGTTDCDVVIVKQEDFQNENATLLGTVKIGDSMFSTKCSEDDVMKVLRREACGVGANVIVLRDIKPPDLSSTCYRVTADLRSATDLTGERAAGLAQQYPLSAGAKATGMNPGLQAVIYIVGFAIGFWLGYTLLH